MTDVVSQQRRLVVLHDELQHIISGRVIRRSHEGPLPDQWLLAIWQLSKSAVATVSAADFPELPEELREAAAYGFAKQFNDLLDHSLSILDHERIEQIEREAEQAVSRLKALRARPLHLPLSTDEEDD